MKKLIALLLCLTLLFCTTMASAAAPTGWKAHTRQAINLKVYLPPEFSVTSGNSVADMVSAHSDSLDLSNALCATSADKRSVLFIMPLAEDYEPFDDWMLSLLGPFLPTFITLLDTSEADILSFEVCKVPDKNHRYVYMAMKVENLYYAAYMPQFEDCHFQLFYFSVDDRITSAEREMMEDILINLSYTGK
ncbi:MAG: hypothetical protein IJE07_09830 [Clostridia bacterium]|nr:hypothetical protein [Clostridia bacterium]